MPTSEGLNIFEREMDSLIEHRRSGNSIVQVFTRKGVPCPGAALSPSPRIVLPGLPVTFPALSCTILPPEVNPLDKRGTVVLMDLYSRLQETESFKYNQEEKEREKEQHERRKYRSKPATLLQHGDCSQVSGEGSAREHLVPSLRVIHGDARRLCVPVSRGQKAHRALGH